MIRHAMIMAQNAPKAIAVNRFSHSVGLSYESYKILFLEFFFLHLEFFTSNPVTLKYTPSEVKPVIRIFDFFS